MKECLQYITKWKDLNKNFKYNVVLAMQKQYKLLSMELLVIFLFFVTLFLVYCVLKMISMYWFY